MNSGLFDDIFADLSCNKKRILEIISNYSDNLENAALEIAFIKDHPDYQKAAGRLEYYRIQKLVKAPYSKAIGDNRFDKILDPQLYRYVQQNAKEIDAIIEADNYSHLKYNWMAMRTMEKGYIIIVKGEILEEPRYAIMRMAIHLFKEKGLEEIKIFYEHVSKGLFHPATPTWFHAGTKFPQQKSCFLSTVHDSLEDILDKYYDTGMISKEGGGNGVGVGRLRHSTVRVNGKSGGVLPWMKMWDEQTEAIDQGGHRKGSFTFFLPIWHVDIPRFKDLRLNTGNPRLRTPNLNLCIWLCDLFMRRVINNEEWSLFCPAQAKGLNDCWGEEFERLYLKYENGNVQRETVNARELFIEICKNQKLTGEPFLMNGDAVNRKSNQKNSGIIEHSNLCLEIVEVTKEDEIAACTLASLCLSKFVRTSEKNGMRRNWFDFNKFGQICGFVVRTLNRVTATNYYPSKKIILNDNKHSPIGVGIQGFADMLALMDLTIINEKGDLDEHTAQFIEKVSACMYYNCIYESCMIAKESQPYPEFHGSPLSQGIFQFDMWDSEVDIYRKWKLPLFQYIERKRDRNIIEPEEWGGYETWDDLRRIVMKHGIANSLVIAHMPTASSAHLQGNNEAFEPFTYNIYVRRVLAGDFFVFNNHIVHDLEDIGLWNSNLVDFILRNDGSIQGIDDYLEDIHSYIDPKTMKRLKFLERKYLTSFEIPMKLQIDLNMIRAKYICQSTSFNIHRKDPTVDDLFNLHIYSWYHGAKTLMYYLRVEKAVEAMKYTLKERKERRITRNNNEEVEKEMVCMKDDENCSFCE